MHGLRFLRFHFHVAAATSGRQQALRRDAEDRRRQGVRQRIEPTCHLLPDGSGQDCRRGAEATDKP
ncbi:MAG: hypothetical protein AW07_02736 [Candidatus Accumulibacter sp. SK-11]|nr:MAG: hypothetical protein AW07_02736 [Candidatus Accumulibacter sp. SK-11]